MSLGMKQPTIIPQDLDFNISQGEDTPWPSKIVCLLWKFTCLPNPGSALEGVTLNKILFVKVEK